MCAVERRDGGISPEVASIHEAVSRPRRGKGTEKLLDLIGKITSGVIKPLVDVVSNGFEFSLNLSFGPRKKKTNQPSESSPEELAAGGVKAAPTADQFNQMPEDQRDAERGYEES